VKKGVGLWGPVILYIGFIFWVSSSYRPIPGIEFFPQIDKLFHALEYLPLGTLLIRAFYRTWGQAPRGGPPAAMGRSWRAGLRAVTLLAAMIVGALDEWYQGSVPGKETEFWDLFADTVGAALGEAVYRF